MLISKLFMRPTSISIKSLLVARRKSKPKRRLRRRSSQLKNKNQRKRQRSMKTRRKKLRRRRTKRKSMRRVNLRVVPSPRETMAPRKRRSIRVKKERESIRKVKERNIVRPLPLLNPMLLLKQIRRSQRPL
jgi:hypothetical protein